MKKVFGFILLSFLMIGYLNAVPTSFSAKEKVAGSYEIDIVGTPEGDYHATIAFKKKDGKWVTDLSDNNQSVPVYKTVVEDNQVTVRFTYQGEDIWFDLEITGDEIKGWANDSWKISGKRIKK